MRDTNAEAKAPRKTKHIESYMDAVWSEYLSMSMLGEILTSALEDGCTTLLVHKADMPYVRKYLFMSGVATWDWDKKTVWGMTLEEV